LLNEQGIGVFRYGFKRTSRNWKLFAAVFVGVLVASTLFATSNVGANALITAMLQKSLEDVSVDMFFDAYSWRGSTSLTSTDLFEIRQTIEHMPHVEHAESLIVHGNTTFEPSDGMTQIWAAGIQANSSLYDGLSHAGGATSLGVNETYLVADSSAAADYPIGSNYSIRIYVGLNAEPYGFLINVTLHVVGYVTLTSQVQNALLGGAYYGGYLFGLRQIIFVTDLEETFLPPLNYAASIPNSTGSNLQARTNIWLDRAALINPYNIQASLQALRQAEYQISNALGGASLNDLLYTALTGFSYQAEAYRWSFLSASMPVFFIAIYMGITLNDVSFSMRRREVGLLLTKGFTRGQITGMFVLESVLLGLLAGALSLVLAVVGLPFLLGITSSLPTALTTIGTDTVFLTLVFGGLVAVLSAYWPARRASQLPTTEALREYTLAGEPTGYRKTLAWTCLILGAYKLVVWSLGINFSQLIANLITTNMILGVLTAFWYIFDELVGFWAPLLFLWGFTTVLVKGSTRFHEYSERFIHRILGDLGGLAAHTIRRRPGRTAAVIFIAALLVGYSVQTVGVLATQQDLAIRGVYKDVGADILVTVNSPENVTNLLPIVRGITGVRAATAQYSFTMYSVIGSMTARAINASEWETTAYFEPEWFLPGISAHQALQALAANNRSIILERLQARQLSLDVGDNLTARFSTGGSPWPLEVAGLFGPEPQYISIPPFITMWSAEATWSYVSVELLSDLGSEVSPTGYILIALDSPTANTAVVDALKGLDDVVHVESAITILEGYNSDILNTATMRVMQMGVLFAFVLASVGTLVVTYLTLRERRLSTALMSARGTTYGQTVVMLLAESLTMMLFAILIGLGVGFIILYGLVRSGVNTNSTTLLVPRFLPAPFLGSVLLQIGAVVGFLLLATLVPILIEARSARHDLSILR
jgi:ABC-type antimicrobial peptide transport system permease subunit